jgi:hypothetical protein
MQATPTIIKPKMKACDLDPISEIVPTRIACKNKAERGLPTIAYPEGTLWRCNEAMHNFCGNLKGYGQNKQAQCRSSSMYPLSTLSSSLLDFAHFGS